MFGYTTNEESDTIPMILELENFMISKNMKMDKSKSCNTCHYEIDRSLTFVDNKAFSINETHNSL